MGVVMRFRHKPSGRTGTLAYMEAIERLKPSLSPMGWSAKLGRLAVTPSNSGSYSGAVPLDGPHADIKVGSGSSL